MPIADTDLPALDVLMHRYRNRPIDFADATLVHLAEQESLSRILTIDHDDFEPYRIKGRPVSGLCLPPTANDGDEFRSAPRRTAENKFTNAPALPIKHAFAR
jgi:hypothetical protein